MLIDDSFDINYMWLKKINLKNEITYISSNQDKD